MSGDACDQSMPLFGMLDERKTGPNILHMSGDIEDVFQYVSDLCTSDPLCSPKKSDPVYRLHPAAASRGTCRSADKKSMLSIHLPPDLGALYPVSTLAYYLGASIAIDGEAYLASKGGGRIALPDGPDLEVWAGETLRRMFYMDCAVRYAAVSGGVLNGFDVAKFLGLHADEIFDMGPGERLQLYSGLTVVPGMPSWHMAAYLDPVPESLEALPFLMRSLSAIYMSSASPVSERGVVSMSIREFLGKGKEPEAASCARGHVVMPSLHEACTQLWFSDGFPVDATKVSVHSLAGRRRSRDKKKVSIGVICNEESMAGEVDAIVDAISGTDASVEILWDASTSKFLKVFARGFDVVQVVGHCDERGFKCRDGFASAREAKENRTPMFFFNSCASYREAARLVESGSVCGVATLFRVLEEAAVDVCRNFYRMLSAGYPASMAIDAARECSALGKEYLLVGDGAFTCFEGDPLKPLYRINVTGDEYSLACTMGNIDKGYIISSWSPRGKVMVSDLGFETAPMSAGQLSAISKKFIGYCIYGHRLYDSVRDAALMAAEGPGYRT